MGRPYRRPGSALGRPSRGPAIRLLRAASRTMAEPSPLLLTTIRTIDRFTDWTGTIVSWLSVPLVAAVAYEVMARYLFNAPTIWAFDVTYMLYGTVFMLGAAYALHKGAHIRTDFFWEQFSTRKKGVIDTISYVLFFFPGFLILLFVSFHEAAYAWRINELSDQTPWRPTPLAVQGRRSAGLPAAADPGLLRIPQEPLHGPHRH